MTKDELKSLEQHLSDLLINDPKLMAASNEYMKRKYPELNPDTFKTDEHAEFGYYALKNEFQLTIILRVIAGFHTLEE